MEKVKNFLNEQDSLVVGQLKSEHKLGTAAIVPLLNSEIFYIKLSTLMFFIKNTIFNYDTRAQLATTEM